MWAKNRREGVEEVVQMKESFMNELNYRFDPSISDD
jgi:hypothetical protein